jgi:Holliday junction resolvasome RuvABC endonuclease subunit
MRSHWEDYKGKRIFIGSYSHMTLEEYRAEVAEVEKETMKHPPDSVLLLVETAGLIMSPEVLSLTKGLTKHTKPYVHKTAILGITGARRALLDMVVKFSGMKVVPFDDAQKAKDWLVS